MPARNSWRTYDAERMYGSFPASERDRFLHDHPPQVLHPDALQPLRVKLGRIQGPSTMGAPARPDHYMGQFNPSIVPAPDGLCPRCAYVASLRIDPLHQCSRKSPLFTRVPGLTRRTPSNAWFRSTAIAVLDVNLEVLGWTWLVGMPRAQINPAWAYKNWTIDFGVADDFRPPWAGQIYDVRLFNFHGRIFATAVCTRCTFALMLVTITGDAGRARQTFACPAATPDGGVVRLRAWRQQDQRFISNKKWAQGRNQAIFAAASVPSAQTSWHSRGGTACGGMATCSRLLVQPWLGVVATFGTPEFKSTRYLCLSRRVRRPPRDETPEGNRDNCAHTPLLQHIDLESVVNPETTSLRVYTHRKAMVSRDKGRGSIHSPPPPPPPPPPPSPPVQANSFGRLELLYNETARLEGPPSVQHVGKAPKRLPRSERARRAPPFCVSSRRGLRRAGLKPKGPRFSTTTNLLQIARKTEGGQRCEGLLGVGHVRRREGDCADINNLCSMFKKNLPPFRYGYQYTHFFYTMESRPPFRMLALSNEFCLQSSQDPKDCESVQFISGMSLLPTEHELRQSGTATDYQLGVRSVVLSYGVNDCESKLARLELDRVLKLLQPVEPGGSVLSNCS